MKNLENYGVQALNANEIREVDGGNPIITFLEKFYAAASYYVENFDSDVLPISNDSTGSALDGYTGSKI